MTSGAATKSASASAAVSAAEWTLRVHLAAAFRMAHHFGWNDTINNHITARLPDQGERFLMNSRGLGWQEITASNLAKLDFDGNIVEGVDGPVGRAGLNFHGAILRAKPEIGCVLHVHAKAGVVISALQDGLRIFDQNSCVLHDRVVYHDFEGYASEVEEGVRIVAELGDKPAMIMWNHGLLTVGRNVAEAFGYMRRLIDACELQERILATQARVREIPAEVLAFTKAQIAERRGNQIFGALEWEMHLREAHRLYPAFAS